jgi:hypothetical protein
MTEPTNSTQSHTVPPGMEAAAWAGRVTGVATTHIEPSVTNEGALVEIDGIVERWSTVRHEAVEDQLEVDHGRTSGRSPDRSYVRRCSRSSTG